MRKNTISLLGAVISVGAAISAASAAPSIGGDPIYTQDDYFTGGLWGAYISSYVFASDSDLPSGFVLADGEMLFAYLLDADDTLDVSIDTFSVGNPFPDDVAITTVGYVTDILPPGFDMDLREDPYLYGYSGPAQASIFTYAGDLYDPYSTLDPLEWSLVYYIAEATTWELGPATVSGGGIGHTQYIPVAAIPAPGALALMGLAGFIGRRRRG